MADFIPIAAAERIGKDRAYDQIIIYARRVGEPGLEWVTTWGKDRAHCAAAARIGDAIGSQVIKPIEARDAEIASLRTDLIAMEARAIAAEQARDEAVEVLVRLNSKIDAFWNAPDRGPVWNIRGTVVQDLSDAQKRSAEIVAKHKEPSNG